MLFARREEAPAHVPPHLRRDFDVFAIDAPDGDFARAMYRLVEAGAPPLFWTNHNEGHWIATDAALITSILMQPDRFSSRAQRVPKSSNPNPPMLPLMVDPPVHIQYRKLLMAAMSPPAMRRMIPAARALSIDLIETLKPRGRCEFMGEFAQQMPIAIFLSMLDLPIEDRPEIMEIINRIIRPDVPETRMRGFEDLGRYTMAKVAERRARPGSDVISALIAARIDGEPLKDADMQGMMAVLMTAGLDTVAGMLGFIALFLARNPAHRRRLAADRTLIPQVMEEFLRRSAMVNLAREVTKDMALGEAMLKAGDLVIVPLALANLAGKYVDRPLEVDFDRASPRHATFGLGPHVCMGAALARAEIAIFLEEWLSRIPDFEVAPGAVLEVRAGAAASLPSLPLVWPT